MSLARAADDKVLGVDALVVLKGNAGGLNDHINLLVGGGDGAIEVNNGLILIQKVELSKSK